MLNTPVGMVCYLWRTRYGFAEIYLAPKNPTPKAVQRGLAHKWNGYGGGMEKEDDGSLFAGTKREVCQESGVIIEESGMEKVAEVLFKNPWGDYFCHFVIAKKFSGDPRPSLEMGKGEWFPFRLDALPFNKMMDSDMRIFSYITLREKFKATVTHNEQMKVVEFKIEFVEKF